MTTEVKLKIPMEYLLIRPAEGEYAEREWECRSFADADAHLLMISQAAPKDGGYDKIDFFVHYADGQMYEGRIDVEHPDRKRPESIGKHMRDFCRFYGGKHPKPWCGAEKYRVYMSRYTPELMAQWEAWATDYQMGDEEAVIPPPVKYQVVWHTPHGDVTWGKPYHSEAMAERKRAHTEATQVSAPGVFILREILPGQEGF